MSPGTDNAGISRHEVEESGGDQLNQTWTIQKIVAWSASYLADKETETPRLDSELLLCQVLKCKRIHLYMNFDQPVTVAERDAYKTLLRRRASGEPIAYILKEKEFMGLTFQVTPAVLIPRPDTELLVETALSFLSTRESKMVLDVGTGSGCICISLAKLGNAKCVAWDTSSAALDVSSRNASSLGVSDICFEAIDALLPSSWKVRTDQFDLIVSNPPYISNEEKPGISRSVKDFEPSTALFANENGLEFYQSMAMNAAAILKPDGCLMVEIGWMQAPEVSRIFSTAGWREIRISKDLGGRDRVVVALPPINSVEA